jgi:putative beta-lysine N-acetyltransferase
MDTITTIQDARIQHGKENSRVYIMDTGSADPENLVKKCAGICRENRYTKIFARIRESQRNAFEDMGFLREAEVPGMFNGIESGIFSSMFIDPQRSHASNSGELETVLQTASARRNEWLVNHPPLPSEYTLSRCTKKHIPEMVSLFKETYKSYPFPITDEAFLKKTMEEHTMYFGIFKDERLIAVSSAEVHNDELNAEMTDFAVDKTHQGNNLSAHLLCFMEGVMLNNNIRTVYTIARAVSFPMNITFAKMGYDFGGLLINNTQISGSIESMNVWWKSL